MTTRKALTLFLAATQLRAAAAQTASAAPRTTTSCRVRRPRRGLAAIRKTLVAFAAVAALAGALASAASACTQWDTTWMQLRQSNGYIVGLPTQSGSTLGGRTNLSAFGWNWQRYVGGGYISGWTYQNRFTATIWWDNGTAGNYDGWIDGSGRISGYTTDRYHPSSTASFTSTGYARCRY